MRISGIHNSIFAYISSLWKTGARSGTKNMYSHLMDEKRDKRTVPLSHLYVIYYFHSSYLLEYSGRFWAMGYRSRIGR